MGQVFGIELGSFVRIVAYYRVWGGFVLLLGMLSVVASFFVVQRTKSYICSV